MSNQEDASEGAAERITDYLTNGGLFNPEHMPQGAVRDLLIDCRAALATLTKERDEARASLAKMREAMAPLVRLANAYDEPDRDWEGVTPYDDRQSIDVTLGMLRRVRAALNEGGGQ